MIFMYGLVPGLNNCPHLRFCSALEIEWMNQIEWKKEGRKEEKTKQQISQIFRQIQVLKEPEVSQIFSYNIEYFRINKQQSKLKLGVKYC